MWSNCPSDQQANANRNKQDMLLEYPKGPSSSPPPYVISPLPSSSFSFSLHSPPSPSPPSRLPPQPSSLTSPPPLSPPHEPVPQSSSLLSPSFSAALSLSLSHLPSFTPSTVFPCWFLLPSDVAELIQDIRQSLTTADQHLISPSTLLHTKLVCLNETLGLEYGSALLLHLFDIADDPFPTSWHHCIPSLLV